MHHSVQIVSHILIHNSHAYKYIVLLVNYMAAINIHHININN